VSDRTDYFVPLKFLYVGKLRIDILIMYPRLDHLTAYQRTIRSTVRAAKLDLFWKSRQLYGTYLHDSRLRRVLPNLNASIEKVDKDWAQFQSQRCVVSIP